MSEYTLDLKGQRFSGARFGRYLRLYCKTNRSYILSYYTIMLIGMIACELVVPVVTRFKAYDSHDSFDIYAITGAVLSGIFAGIMLLEGGRRVYNRMARPDIKNTLMVPASQFEKSLVWFLIWIAGSWAGAALSFAAAEGLRLGASHIFATHPEWIMSVCDKHIPLRDASMLICSVAFSQALFVLAGSVWYRNTWVKMIAMYFAFQTISTIVMVGVLISQIKTIKSISVVPETESVGFEDTLVNSSIIYSCIGIVLCYLIAYCRNKENGLNFRW